MPVCVVAGAPLSVKLVWFRFKACRVFVCVYYIRKCVCVCVPWQVHPRPSSWCGSGSSLLCANVNCFGMRECNVMAPLSDKLVMLRLRAWHVCVCTASLQACVHLYV